MKPIDLRSESQQKEGTPYYPGVFDCGNCGAHWVVIAAKGTGLAQAALAFECPRCGLVGKDVDGGHLVSVMPCGMNPEDYMPVEDDGDIFLPGDDLVQ